MQAGSSKIGFIGLGIMGTPMCGHLIAAGHELFVRARGQLPPAIAATSTTPCASNRAVAQQAEVVFLMLPDTPDVEEVLFGEYGVASGLSAGKVVVDMSSISPVATKDFARRVEALGCAWLDAPVSGGEVGARNATLSIMAGASPPCSSASGRCWPPWAGTSTWWEATATARPPRWPTRSSWR